MLLVIVGFSFNTTENEFHTIPDIKIDWTTNLKGDFTFKNKWNYPEYVYKNSFGQLSCDGSCPDEIYLMKDETGKIYKDSLEAFYKIIDTTHVFHSLKSENKMYEYSGTDFIQFKKLKNGLIKGTSATNVSTHSSLIIEIQKDSSAVYVDFNSIRDLGEHIFPLESGTLKIDETLFKEGIIKAEFDFKFKNTLEPDKNLFWKGKIYSKIESE